MYSKDKADSLKEHVVAESGVLWVGEKALLVV